MIRRWLSIGWPLAAALASGLALLLWGAFQPPAPAAAAGDDDSVAVTVTDPSITWCQLIDRYGLELSLVAPTVRRNSGPGAPADPNAPIGRQTVQLVLKPDAGLPSAPCAIEAQQGAIVYHSSR